MAIPVAFGKRKAEPATGADDGNLECPSSLGIKAGAASSVTASASHAVVQSLQDSIALNLRSNKAAKVEGKTGTDEEGAPISLEVSGFHKEELNRRYTVRPEALLRGRRTYWSNVDAADSSSKSSQPRYFLGWQSSVGRWTLCEGAGLGDGRPDAEELDRCTWLAFQVGAAALTGQCVWMEKGDGGWSRCEDAQVTVVEGAVSAPPRPWESQQDLPPSMLDFIGFYRLDLNCRFTQRPELTVAGKPTYWDTSNRLMLYWQSTPRRWAVCGKTHIDEARAGQCPACAFQLDLVPIGVPSRWVEYHQGAWIAVPAEVTPAVAEVGPQMPAGRIAEASSSKR